MKAHIITCDSRERLQEFVDNGYAGVRPIPPKTLSKRGLSRKLSTNWDVIADLKRVKAGDLIFLHVEKGLYGLFRATSCFKEERDMPDVYKSKNLNLDYWTKNRDYWPPDIEKDTMRLGKVRKFIGKLVLNLLKECILITHLMSWRFLN